VNDAGKYYQCICGKLHLVALMNAVTEAAKEYRCGLCGRQLAVWVAPPEALPDDLRLAVESGDRK
jgi:hypothetical protein